MTWNAGSIDKIREAIKAKKATADAAVAIAPDNAGPALSDLSVLKDQPKTDTSDLVKKIETEVEAVIEANLKKTL